MTSFIVNAAKLRGYADYIMYQLYDDTLPELDDFELASIEAAIQECSESARDFGNAMAAKVEAFDDKATPDYTKLIKGDFGKALADIFIFLDATATLLKDDPGSSHKVAFKGFNVDMRNVMEEVCRAVVNRKPSQESTIYKVDSFVTKCLTALVGEGQIGSLSELLMFNPVFDIHELAVNDPSTVED